MSQTLRIAMAQTDFHVGALDRNLATIRDLIATARDVHKADLLLLPEMALCGYVSEDLYGRPGYLRRCEQAVQELAAEVSGISVVIGWPETAGSVVYNAASLLRDGRVEATYRKRFLPNYTVFDEARYFAVDPDGGDCVFDVNGVKVGLIICEDIWYAEPLASTVQAGAELVLVPNASPFERDKHAQRDRLLATRVAESGAGIAYLNVVGGQDGLVFDGSSVLADGDGTVHTAAESFADALLVADFDAGTRKFTQVQWPEETDESAVSLMWRAIVRGTRDYCLKNGFKKVWLGLSGGIDSSLVLVAAAEALGPENVTAVRMPSRYTADLSNDLAQEQCDRLGVSLMTLPVELPFQGFLDTLAPVFEGHAVDTTEENLQSRIRGALLMALSNKMGGLVLTTGNKSEYAVGYCTIYGDMCGGYAVIKDVYKTEVFELARWLNARAGAPVIPVGVIERPPSAELRENQKDQDSLPPYDVLDAILQRHLEQQQDADEIIAAGFQAETVQRVLHLVRISEWKRQQAAPGPKVSHRAFGRERRYPITNGYR
ncbi:NAD+ synthase [Luteimonas sp. FXH3W]|uniref:Glutamine-dependent NAD(+) synthetase n=1 Tax=Aquilutibacter rugosus TaxID=3115820 RepID=A0ABU7V028_9GAMM